MMLRLGPQLNKIMQTSLPKSLHASSCGDFSFLEPLEDRIAPATINAGPETSGGQQTGGVGFDHNGLDAKGNVVASPFFSTDPDALFNPSTNLSISDLFNDSSDHYYITLKKGDTLKVYNPAPGVGYESFVQVTSGEIIAFFHDVNADGNVDKNELTGLSLGAGAGVSVFGTVNGDILTNYNSKTKEVSATSLISGAQSIAGLFISGDVNGSIIAGGNISKVTVVGNVEHIYTGSAADGYAYDFGGASSDGEGTLGTFLTPGVKQTGGSISKVTVGSTDSIVASDGGLSSAGGSLSAINLISDSNGFILQAGNGGAGASTSAAGGKGGSISTVYAYGVEDSSPLNEVRIVAGQGGDGFAGGPVFGNGGAGGALANIFVGYQLEGKKQVISTSLLADKVFVWAGDGGDGKVAGVGGSIKGVKVAVASVDDPTPSTYELEVRAGDGGSSDAFNVTKTVAGAGGTVTSVEVRNFQPSALEASILVRGGDAGLANLSPLYAGSGNRGGGIASVTALGFDLDFIGGAGSEGYTNGGAGGAISSLVVETFGDILTDELLVQAGVGGDATTGNAGAGGSVSKLTFGNIDLDGTGSAIIAGIGGTSVNGRGGAGGSIASVILNDVDSLQADIDFVAGVGGNGAKGGGNGGNISSITLVGVNLIVNFTAGDGGNGVTAVGNAAGGAGGSLNTLGASVDFNVGSYVDGTVGIAATAGGGGDSAGKAKAGNGGFIFKANFSDRDDIILTAGVGGAGGLGGTSGVGGYIKTSGISSLDGATHMTAGDGGALTANPAKGGAGGSLSGVTLVAGTDILIQGGNGTGGGAGGSISSTTFVGHDSYAPDGSVTIQAGNGSSLLTLAGAGGSLSKLVGYAAGSISESTLIRAGNGGGGTKGGAAGGSISNLTILGGNSSDQFTIWAGDGGNALTTGKGGAGGGIASINIGEVDVSNLVAGNGGNSATNTGGVGGSISKVYSRGEIGTMNNVAQGFGFDDSSPLNYYDHLGGIFAGQGGTGVVKGLPATAKSGSVISVTADAISSITAGRGVAIALSAANFVTKVDQIYLNGLTTPEVDTDGSYTNWPVANVVGGIAGSFGAPDANIYKVNDGGYVPLNYSGTWLLNTTVPLDGLIAALNLGVKRNFEPNAFLTLDSAGDPQFAGLRVS